MSLTVSVIIATHDRPQSLGCAVQAVLRQGRLPEELIVTNDGRDEIPPFLEAQARAAGVGFSCRRLLRPSLPASRNSGIAVARGDILMLLDDDMIMPPDFLHRLVELYAADAVGVVAGIGAAPIEARPPSLPGRVWQALAEAMGQARWGPRQWAAHRASLPPALRGRLLPARQLMGGTISLRRGQDGEIRFDESMGGYALGEDLEFCFRYGRRHALFLAPELRLDHRSAAGGRPGKLNRGRMYVANMLSIFRTAADRGAGTVAILAGDLLAIFWLHLLFGLAGRHWYNVEFSLGMLAEAATRVRRIARSWLCGC